MDKHIPIDYSKKENWCKLPQVTKEVDTFYVYATEYIMGSMAEGAPDYADMNNQEMLEGAQGEYLLHASAYADAQVFPDRGVVVTHAQGEEMTEEKASVASSFFGPDGRHGEDYVLFYNNIKENVAKRVAAYLQGKKVHSS